MVRAQTPENTVLLVLKTARYRPSPVDHRTFALGSACPCRGSMLVSDPNSKYDVVLGPVVARITFQLARNIDQQ